ncbi:MAG: tetratricopeptide repeat protein [Alphaproteobacteria bacterium]
MPRRFFDLLTIAGFFSLALIFLPGCNSEVLEKQAEQLKQQEAEITRQRQEIEALKAGQKIQDQKQQDCNRAFRDFFEKAQATPDRDRAISLYREGLGLCPDDDIAHYELGKMLAAAGRKDAAQQEFEAALKINPGFIEAKNELETLQNSR